MKLQKSFPSYAWKFEFIREVKLEANEALGWTVDHTYQHNVQYFEARRLFSPDYYTGNPTTQEVATRIRNFVHHVG